ncbi:MAG TPA: class I SAM-dependent DNA methyltransferase [Candidatus Saccharibacteria bacterium]|nr:class I SAM-dependent DNA methyltransferase [Candidatus Saccharibacteria bacterium]
MEIQDIQSKLWAAADKLRGNISSSDYKYVVLGLIFLKYISDAFETQYKKAETESFNPEDRDYYLADNVFWVPPEARWHYLVTNAKQPSIGMLIDSAMDAVERDNPSLKGVLPKNYAREALDKRRLGELIDLFTNITFQSDNSKDLLGQVYEYFMGMFADSEGKHGGEFYTPRSIVKLLVEMLEPYGGRVYDPACGSGGMFVQSEKFVEEHSGRIGDIAIYGQELNETTWRLAKMNMAIRGIDADIRRGDTFHDDKFPDLKADYIIANPPFNISDWGVEHLQDDIRWRYGLPPKGNANYGWIQHMIHHLSPKGTAGFVLANGSMSSQSSGEGEIRKKLLEADLVDCIVTLPSQLFFNTGIPACLWFVSRDRVNRSGKTLFIDGRNLGKMVTRRNRELTPEDIASVATAYHNFKTQNSEYQDVPGFAKVAMLEEIAEHDYVLTPGRYVGSEEVEEDDEAFAEKMERLTAELGEQFTKSHELEAKIKENLEKIKW